jgi:RimJ/RimL family protein N-acetyltransferase
MQDGISAHAPFGAVASARTGVTFRPITPADMEFMRELYASTREEELAPVPWPEEAKRHFLAEQFALQHRHYQTYHAQADFLLILRGTEPIGRIYVDRANAEIGLIDIALTRAHRGHGIGTALLAELVDEGRRAARVIELYVEPNNPARRLYERFGFRLVQNRGVYDFMRWTPATE